MVRLVAVVLLVTLIASVCAAAATGPMEDLNGTYSVTASGGSLSLGHVSGGRFGDGSFSIGHGGNTAGSGHGGHGGNHGTNSYGGSGGDSGHTNYA